MSGKWFISTKEDIGKTKLVEITRESDAREVERQNRERKLARIEGSCASGVATTIHSILASPRRF